MKKISLIARLSALCLLCIASVSIAAAQANRTWVGGSGNDANAATNCQRTAPCRTFAIALSKTNIGGAINVTDPGDFGPVRINKSVTIDGGGIFAGIQVGGDADAISIISADHSVVVLRGLTLDGLNIASVPGRHGVSFETAGSLYVENCVIQNFNGNAVNFAENNVSPIYLFVKDTVVRNNYGGGILVSGTCDPRASGARAIIEKTRMEGNTYGVRSTGRAITTVRDSVAAGSGNAGYLVDMSCGGAGGTMIIENSLATHNVNGFKVEAGTMSISNIVAIGNITNDVLVGTGGALQTYGNNKYVNGPSGAPLPVR